MVERKGGRRGNRIQLLRADGTHRCWIKGEDARKLVAGGHVEEVKAGKVRLLTDREKYDRKKNREGAMESAGLRVVRKQVGLGKIF